MACIMILMIIILYYQITYKIQCKQNMDGLKLYYDFINLYQFMGRITLKNDIVVSCDYIVINGLIRLKNNVNVQNIACYFFCPKLTNNRAENASHVSITTEFLCLVRVYNREFLLDRGYN